MKKKIVISSNCQTGGLYAAFKCYFPNENIVPFPTPKLEETQQVEKLTSVLNDADFWITDKKIIDTKSKTKVFTIPNIYFRAFHPDLTYATKQSTNEITLEHYNSNIAIWAYNRGLSIANTELLFNAQVYEDLGYLACWESSYDYLQQRFLDANILKSDFEKLFMGVVQQGVFMHTINHPKSEILIALASLIIDKMNIESDMDIHNINTIDTLACTSWPLYPGVAALFNVPSNYVWKIVDQPEINGVSDYLAFIFNNYKKQNIEPGDLYSYIPLSDEQTVILERYL